PPRGRRAPGNEEDGGHSARRDQRGQPTWRVAAREQGREERRSTEQQGDRPPAARRRQEGHQSEAPAERARDGPERVGEIGEAHVSAEIVPSGSEQGDQQRELHAGQNRRKENDDEGDDGP